MKRIILIVHCISAVVLGSLEAQAQWPRPEGNPWTLPDFLPYFDTCQLSLDPVRLEAGGKPTGYSFIGTEDWQTHALLVFMGVQARSYETFAPEPVQNNGQKLEISIHRVFHFDDWAVHVVANQNGAETRVFGAILRDSAGFQASRELFSLLDSGGHEW